MILLLVHVLLALDMEKFSFLLLLPSGIKNLPNTRVILRLWRETTAVYCEDRTKYVNTICGQNLEFLMLEQMVYVIAIQL
jgi:hypothetical protein